MKVLVTGASGLIGSHLVRLLRSRGDEVLVARRGVAPSGDNAVRWDTVGGRIDLPAGAEIDAVVHLAGAGIGEKRWNSRTKAEIMESRVKGTRQVVEMLAAQVGRPVRLLSASAIGIYGDRGEEVLTEQSRAGSGFLAEVVKAWEAEADRASQAGHSVATLRTGIVLDSHGGALQKQLPIFKAGLGASLGSGKQWMSWIHRFDEVAAIAFLLDRPGITGPVNLVAPNPVTNTEFTRILGKALSRPALLHAPGLALSTLLGREMAHELLLSSQRVEPSVLKSQGFEFLHPLLYAAMADLLWAG
ncbi:MAG: TIGR01777 family oxidoreductase [Actinomycetota bacterium]|nr:TIGR01777 family oxidoreductase [Actinomycetota bacterium]